MRYDIIFKHVSHTWLTELGRWVGNPDILSSHLGSDLGSGVHCSVKTAQSMVEVRVHGTQALFPWLFRAEVYSLSVHPLQWKTWNMPLGPCVWVLDQLKYIQGLMQNILFSLEFNTETWKRVRGQEYWAVYPVLIHSGLREGWCGFLGGGGLARKPEGQAWGVQRGCPLPTTFTVVTATAVQVPATQQTLSEVFFI